jgi:hypothetical protein
MLPNSAATIPKFVQGIVLNGFSLLGTLLALNAPDDAFFL